MLHGALCSDWKADGCQWLWISSNAMPDNRNDKNKWANAQYKKIQYNVVNHDGCADGGFKRIVYQSFKRDKTYFIVHYKGDESKAGHLPHANSVDAAVPYQRCMPSVLKDIKSRASQKPGTIYKSMSSAACDPDYEGIATPRNYKQVRNTVFNERDRRRVNKDEIIAITLLCEQIDFVQLLQWEPTLVVIMGRKQTCAFVDHLIARDEILQLGYDTTFNLCDAYVTPLLLRIPLFDGEPVVPFL